LLKTIRNSTKFSFFTQQKNLAKLELALGHGWLKHVTIQNLKKKAFNDFNIPYGISKKKCADWMRSSFNLLN